MDSYEKFQPDYRDEKRCGNPGGELWLEHGHIVLRTLRHLHSQFLLLNLYVHVEIKASVCHFRLLVKEKVDQMADNLCLSTEPLRILGGNNLLMNTLSEAALRRLPQKSCVVEKFHPGNRAEVFILIEKISSPITEILFGKTEISATEPALPLIRTHGNFSKGFSNLVVRRDPVNRASRADMNRPLKLLP